MLSKINRIKKKKDFETIFKNSKSLKNDLFIFKTTKNNLALNRFGFVVSQKVSKKAVVRNKIKRRLVAAVKTKIKNMKIGTDVVLIALPGIRKRSLSDIKEAVNNTLAKSGLIVK
jgi:ribonuclease P protein component